MSRPQGSIGTPDARASGCAGGSWPKILAYTARAGQGTKSGPVRNPRSRLVRSDWHVVSVDVHRTNRAAFGSKATGSWACEAIHINISMTSGNHLAIAVFCSRSLPCDGRSGFAPYQVQQALEQTQFTLGIESARRARLEKKHGELDETGLVSPRSLSPRISRQSKAPDPVGADPQTEKTGQPPLARTSSAR